jgi:predicted ATPase/DNA-binding XRE family transcriptional regulator
MTKLMKRGAPASFGAHLKALREAAAFTQEELATIAGLSVQAVSALERGERRRPHLETVRALSAALDLNSEARDALIASARAPAPRAAVDELSGVSLPVALTVLVGREADVQMLQQWLADPAARLITLVGPGGVGKTRLALEVAREIAKDGASRVMFVELAAILDPSFVAAAIGEALGLSDVTAGDLARRVRVACDKEHPTLLVLDNCEHLLDAAPLVAELLTAAASFRLLATSRAALRVRGERLYAVGPLGLPTDSDVLSPADLARIPAVRLFVERVRDVQPDFRLTSINGGAVAAICRRLDALPLALELAAPRTKVLTVDDLLHRLERDVLLSSVGPRDLPERQQTMNATVAWSYHLLDSEQQRAFRRLGVLPGRFPIEIAANVLGDHQGSSAAPDAAFVAIAALIERSLLHRIDTPAARPIYQMLETVRTYALLELAAAGEQDEASEGLARYCRDEAALAGEGLVGSAQAEWLSRVSDNLHNHRGALTWLIGRGHAAEACDIAWGLLFFWLIRGRAAEGLQWYELILTLPSLPPAAESRALLGTAVMSHAQGNVQKARTRLERALTLACSSGDVAVAVQAENLMGHIENAAGNVKAARELLARSVEGFRALKIPWGTGNALLGLAGVAIAAGDTDQAERLLDDATSILQNAGPWFLNLPLYVRAILAVRHGNPDRALEFVRESLVCSRQLHDRFAFVYALVPLAAAAALKGDAAWAARVLGARDAVTERAGAVAGDGAVRDLRDMAEQRGRARLGPDRWARAYAAGRGASIDSMLQDIDRARPSNDGATRSRDITSRNPGILER